MPFKGLWARRHRAWRADVRADAGRFRAHCHGARAAGAACTQDRLHMRPQAGRGHPQIVETRWNGKRDHQHGARSATGSSPISSPQHQALRDRDGHVNVYVIGGERFAALYEPTGAQHCEHRRHLSRQRRSRSRCRLPAGSTSSRPGASGRSPVGVSRLVARGRGHRQQLGDVCSDVMKFWRGKNRHDAEDCALPGRACRGRRGARRMRWGLRVEGAARCPVSPRRYGWARRRDGSQDAPPRPDGDRKIVRGGNGASNHGMECRGAESCQSLAKR